MWIDAALRAAARARSRRIALLAGIGVTATLAIVAYRPFLDVGFVGWDTYPMIVSSRVESLLDLGSAFREELMDGRYTDGHFYRPVTSLSFALDYALFGLEPRGFHSTDLAILVANACLLLGLAQRLLGPRASLGAVLAALVFALHPVHLEVLPVPPRRGDSLALLFVLATLLIQTSPRARAGLRGALATGMLALCAMGAKETGAVVLPLVFLMHGLRDQSGRLTTRARGALLRTSPVAVAALVYACGRGLAVGGLGGHDESLISALLAVPETMLLYLARLLHPQPLLESPTGARVLVLGSALGLTILAVAAWRRSATEAEAPATTLPFLGLWLLSTLALSSLSGRRQEWYLLLFVAPYALLLGALLEEGRVRWREGRSAVAVPALVFPLLLAASHIGQSSLLRSYPEWEHASVVAGRFLERFDRVLAGTRPGEVRVLDGLPLRSRQPGPKPRIHSTWIFSDYSLQAYAELRAPERRVEVLALPRTGPQGVRTDTARIYVTPSRLLATNPRPTKAFEDPGSEGKRAGR
jgi:hypothetical protein